MSTTTRQTCKGTNCHAIDGISHSSECRAEHDAIVFYAAVADHVLHAGWECSFCGYDGQDNVRFNFFCSECHQHR